MMIIRGSRIFNTDYISEIVILVEDFQCRAAQYKLLAIFPTGSNEIIFTCDSSENARAVFNGIIDAYEKGKKVFYADEDFEDDGDEDDSAQLPTLDGEVILCGTVCQVAEDFFTIRLGETIKVVQISCPSGYVASYVKSHISVDDFVQVKVQFLPTRVGKDTILYKLAIKFKEDFVGHVKPEG